MNRFRALAVVPLLTLTACHIRTAEPGDITFLWTFANQSCAQAGVQTVHIDIPGQALANNGDFDCTTAGTDGIVLHDFDPGDYSFDIAGYDSAGTQLYASDGTITVDGSVNVPVDLDYVVGGMALSPVLDDGSGNIVDCTGETYAVDVLDGNNKEVFGGIDPGPYLCGDTITYSNLSADTYSVIVYGYFDGSQTATDQSDPTPYVVTDGVFPQPTVVHLFQVQ